MDLNMTTTIMILPCLMEGIYFQNATLSHIMTGKGNHSNLEPDVKIETVPNSWNHSHFEPRFVSTMTFTPPKANHSVWEQRNHFTKMETTSTLMMNHLNHSLVMEPLDYFPEMASLVRWYYRHGLNYEWFFGFWIMCYQLIQDLGMSALLVSTLTIVTQMALSHVIRTQLCSLITHNFFRGILLELVATAEMCGACFELIIIADNYGVYAYAVCLFLMTIWWGQSWGSATACPYSLLEDYVEKGGDAKEVGAKILAQVLGGVASFRWVKRLWVMELAVTHVGRGVDKCFADLQVPMLYGFLIELVLTCACRLMSRALGEIEPRFASSIDSFFATSMVVLAFDTSGGYFNPVLATGLKWGCRGHTHVEHLVVYWAGAILGSMISLKLWNITRVRDMLVRPFMGKQEKAEKIE